MRFLRCGRQELVDQGADFLTRSGCPVVHDAPVVELTAPCPLCGMLKATDMVLKVLSHKVLDGVSGEVIHSQGASSLMNVFDVAQVHTAWSLGHGRRGDANKW